MSPTMDLPPQTLPDLSSNAHVKGSLTLSNYKYLGPAPLTGAPPPALYTAVAVGIADALEVPRKRVYVSSVEYSVSGAPGGGRRTLEGGGRRRLQTVALDVTFYVLVTEGGGGDEMAELLVDRVYDGKVQEELKKQDDLESVEIDVKSLDVEGATTGWKREVKKWWQLAKEHWAAVGVGVAFGGAVVGVGVWKMRGRKGEGEKQKLILDNERPSQDLNRMGLGAIYGNDNGML
ncbi:hypothetical protein TrRE_jg5569 [Triparma retinervis]|uniref:Uncharacterized protein n=1 Tax=Triparma retinervis TaxID=2557542 RepID=A0A9W6ZAK6_9STRA|nr:hypothetical protein TrRE_jg5569 [Triparma retinervis]